MEGVEETEEVKKAERGEERVEGADFRAWSRCGGVTGAVWGVTGVSEKAAGAETGSQKASRSGLMSKGTGVMGSRPTELNFSKHEGTAEGGNREERQREGEKEREMERDRWRDGEKERERETKMEKRRERWRERDGDERRF